MVALIADAFLPPHAPVKDELTSLGRAAEGAVETIDVTPDAPLDERAHLSVVPSPAIYFDDDDLEALHDDDVTYVPDTVTFGDDVPRPVLSLLPQMADTREKPRRKVALKAWLMTLDGATRGYALDLSEGGARLGGMGTHHEVGSTLFAKICLEPHESPIVVRCKVVRYSAPAGRTLATEISVRFVDVNLDEWFRLARFLDKEAALEAQAAS